MAGSKHEKLLAELRQYDTPSVTNVVATYPGHPLCLSLYSPWSESWYTDQSVRCCYPELGALAGYAVTCTYGLPEAGFSGVTFMDVIDALDASPKPTIFVFQQKFPPALQGKVGLAGGNMTAAMKAVGCVGAISNGPSRDIDEIRPMKFQYLLSGVTPGHGPQAVHAVNVPVSVAGMDVAPGEIVHMDENGACKFPAHKLEAVVANLRGLRAEEGDRIGKLQRATSAAQVRAIFAGRGYAAGGGKKAADKSASSKPAGGKRAAGKPAKR
jgi:regulator of RNase E activity RraA